jgi:formylglycine-generating enzyme
MKKSGIMFIISLTFVVSCYRIDAEKLIQKGFVFIEGGTFSMGASRKDVELIKNWNEGWERQILDQHEVKLSSFYMKATEETTEEFHRFLDDTKNVYEFIEIDMDLSTYMKSKDNRPALVSFEIASEYCNWLSRKDGYKECYFRDKSGEIRCNYNIIGYRMPTEAEWEYAAREGKYKSDYQFSGSDNIDEVAVHNVPFKAGLAGMPKAVKSKKPNKLGLYDLTGNAGELCNDYYQEDYYKVSPRDNPLGPVNPVIVSHGASARVCRDAFCGSADDVVYSVFIRDKGFSDSFPIGIRLVIRL